MLDFKWVKRVRPSEVLESSWLGFQSDLQRENSTVRMLVEFPNFDRVSERRPEVGLLYDTL